MAQYGHTYMNAGPPPPPPAGAAGGYPVGAMSPGYDSGSAYPQGAYPPSATVPPSYPEGAVPPGAYPGDTGGYDAESGGGNNSELVGTSDVKVRLGFLRKVYGLLTLCFAVTVGIACVFSLVDPVRSWIVARYWMVWVGLGVGLVSYLALMCIRLKRPMNAIVLGFFVLGFSVMIGTMCAMYFEVGWGGVVLQAFAATAAIFLAITGYVLVTKKDFSYIGGFLFGALVALIVLSILTFVVQLVVGRLSKWIYFGISVLGALIFTGYILYDTSLILHKLGPDDWIQGVVSLYVDVTQLFLYMLQIFSIIQT